jgi:hypothetical protein
MCLYPLQEIRSFNYSWFALFQHLSQQRFDTAIKNDPVIAWFMPQEMNKFDHMMALLKFRLRQDFSEAPLAELLRSGRT